MKRLLVTEGNLPWGEATSCTWCGKCVAVCPTGSLSYQGTSVGEMVHQADLVTRLAAARKGEWLDPSIMDGDYRGGEE